MVESCWTCALLALLGGCGRVGFDAIADGGTIAIGCLASETAGPFHADFELGTPQWGMPYNGPMSQVAFSAGVMTVVPADSAAPNYSGLTSANADFRNRRLFVEVPTMVNTATDTDVGLAIERNANGVPYAQVYEQGGLLYAETDVGGVFDTSTVPFDPIEHRWWQLHEQAGTITFQTSTDGVVWTTIAQKPTPAFVNDAYLDLYAGIETIQPGTLGMAQFDNLFDCLTP